MDNSWANVITDASAVIIMDRGIMMLNNYLKRKYVMGIPYDLHIYVLSSIIQPNPKFCYNSTAKPIITNSV